MIWKAEVIGPRGGRAKRRARSMFGLARKFQKASIHGKVVLMIEVSKFWEEKLQEIIDMDSIAFKKLSKRIRRRLR